jgi:RecA/RadA recombinase
MNHFHEPYQHDYVRRALSAAHELKFGVSYLDDALGGILPTDLVLLGARTGVGKTQIATQIALTNAKAHKKVHFFALEAERGEIESRLRYRRACQLYYQACPPIVAGDYVRYYDYRTGQVPESFNLCAERAHEELAVDCDTLTTIYRDKIFTADDFVKIFEGVQYDTDLIIVDHLHYFDMDGANENQGLKDAIRKIRSAALEFEKPVILLAHLRKTDRNVKSEIPDIDEFYGHSDLVKIATNVILAARAENAEAEDKTRRGTYLHMPKSRFCPEAIGYAGLIAFDIKTGMYENEYYLAKTKRFESPELIGSKYDFPRWAKRAKEIQNLSYRAGQGIAGNRTSAFSRKDKSAGDA